MKKVLTILKSAAGKVSLATLAAGASATVALAEVNVGSGTVKRVPVLDVNLSDLVSNIINVILIIAGVLAVIYLIWGGITYVTAGGDAEKAGKGRTAITNAIIGVVIIVTALAIYNAVISGVGTGALQ
jgi:hypothetical protein